MKSLSRLILLMLLAIVAAGTLTHEAMAEGQARTLCVFDPSGANGDLYKGMVNYQTDAAAWGVNFTLKPYTSETGVIDDFKAGQCNAILVTGTRARAFVKRTGSIEAIGALPTYKLLKKAIKTLSKPKAAKLSKSGEYENVGIIPTGGVYLLVNDKSINTIEKLSGKRIATFSFDDAAKTMVDEAGASIASAEISSFAGMFNNRSVDACYAPATVVKPLELTKGLGSKGGMVHYPIAQTTVQIIIKSSDFPADYGVKSREHVAKKFDDSLKAIKSAEKGLGKYWIEIPPEDKQRYDRLFRTVRIKLRDKKTYDKTMLKIMFRLRCKADASRAECAEKGE